METFNVVQVELLYFKRILSSFNHLYDIIFLNIRMNESLKRS